MVRLRRRKQNSFVLRACGISHDTLISMLSIGRREPNSLKANGFADKFPYGKREVSGRRRRCRW